MVAKSGDALLRPEAIESLKDLSLPLAAIITPNLPEAAALLGRAEVTRREEMAAVAGDLLALGPRAVLLKGGHLTGEGSPDLLFDGGEAIWFEAERVETPNTHGTGCTLSSAIAAGLARGWRSPTRLRWPRVTFPPPLPRPTAWASATAAPCPPFPRPVASSGGLTP